MSSVSPSLVEAAARAVYASFPAEDRDESDPEQFETCLRDTRTALEAVGDALRLEGREAAQFEACGITDADLYAAHGRGRLEGAQAERERIVAIIKALHIPYYRGEEISRARLLAALGVQGES